MSVLDENVWSLLDLTKGPEWETLEAYLNRMLTLCVQLFQASGASIFLGRDGTDEFAVTTSCGSLSRIPEGASIQRGRGIAGVAIQEERPMLVADPQTEPCLEKLGIERRHEIGSSMIVPLCTPHGGCFGVINLSRGHEETPFSQEDLSHAEAITRQVALAVTNARMFVKTNMLIAEARSLHEKLQAVIESMGFGLLVLDANERLTDSNPAAVEVLGSDACAGRTWHDVVHAAPKHFRDPLLTVIRKGLAGQKAQERAADPQSEQAWLLVVSPLASGGCTVAIENLTENERQQRELERAKRLAEIGQLTAAIAHEVRNPLTGIRSASQMIRTNPELTAEFAGVIEDEAVKLDALCNAFLDFAKPLSLNQSSLSAQEFVERVVGPLMPSFEAAGVSLEVDVRAPESVQGDMLRLEQALRNLLQNALQACKSGDSVRVEFNDGCLSISDTGCGMEPDTLGKLFTPFFSTRPTGTGLGLSNTRKILDAHGASIDVQSRPGEGSRFTITFRQRLAA